MSNSSSPALFSTRTALILLLAAASGATAGVLTFLAGNNVATAVLTGLASAAAASAYFHAHLAHDTSTERHTPGTHDQHQPPQAGD